MKAKPNSTVEQVKNFIRQPFAWPGAYPLYIVCTDGGAICRHCAKENAKLIIRGTAADDKNSTWTAAGVDVNWEDANLYCDNCGQPLDFAYGEKTE